MEKVDLFSYAVIAFLAGICLSAGIVTNHYEKAIAENGIKCKEMHSSERIACQYIKRCDDTCGGTKCAYVGVGTDC